MSIPISGRRYSVSYPGGTVVGSGAVLQKILGTLEVGWVQPITDTEVERKRPYSSRRASRCAPGTPCTITFTDESKWTVRVTGTQKAFMANLLSQGSLSDVALIKFQRKTIYSPEPIEVAE